MEKILDKMSFMMNGCPKNNLSPFFASIRYTPFTHKYVKKPINKKITQIIPSKNKWNTNSLTHLFFSYSLNTGNDQKSFIGLRYQDQWKIEWKGYHLQTDWDLQPCVGDLRAAGPIQGQMDRSDQNRVHEGDAGNLRLRLHPSNRIINNTAISRKRIGKQNLWCKIT